MSVPVHEKLQEVLAWSGISQYELARRAGVSKGSIGAYISGRTKISLDLLQKFSRALDVSPWVLLNGEPLPVTQLDLTEAERRMIADVRGLRGGQAEIVQAVIDAMKRQNKV